jgi:glycosyltransferase involved in cell wall biosynthesis
LPVYLKAFDAIVIPYRLGATTRGIFPLKFFESLASGRPVVISRLPALEAYYADVLVAEDAGSFVDACAAAVARQDDAAARDRRMALARRNTWESRIAQMLRRLDELDTLDRPPRPP